MRVSARTVRPKDKLSGIVAQNLRRAAHYAADQATLDAKKQTRAKIQGAGLGRLANAVGDTSSLRKRRTESNTAWGAIFARGGKESRANQALTIYSKGGTIAPIGGKKWLAFPNIKVIGSRVGRRKITPALYSGTGPGRNGPLRFVPINTKSALLVLKDQNVSKRTGRAKPFRGKTPRSATREKFVIAFFLIRYTRRAQRFNQGAIMLDAARGIPRHARDFQLGRTGSA